MSDIELLDANTASLNQKIDDELRRREEIDNRIKEWRAQIAENEAAKRALLRVRGGPLLNQNLAAAVAAEQSSPPTKFATVKEAMKHTLILHPGMKVASLIAEAQKALGTEIKPKTASNTLSALKSEGHAKRRGRKWYPVPNEAGKQNTPLAN